MGAAAYTVGNRIYLADDLRATPEEWLELVGHELAHVEQQRAGRVLATRWMDGHPVNDDAALEREAEECGRRFARGEWRPRWMGAGAVNGPAVVQRSVTIGGRVLTHTRGLAGSTQAVLEMTNGGMEWLSWAISSRVELSFESERDLVVGVQRGLHGDPLMLIPNLGLRVHPDRLMALNTEQLAALQSGAAAPVLTQQGLLTQQDLSLAGEFLTQLGVSGAALFQSLSLSDQIALTNLARAGSVPKANEAAQFAVQQAQTVPEFVDYFRFYGLAAGAGTTPATRARMAQEALSLLLSTVWGTLSGPTLGAAELANPELVRATIANWSATGNTLGFARVSSAALQLAQAGALQATTVEGVQQRMQQYLTQAQSFVLRGGLGVLSLSQAGESVVVLYRSDAAVATVQVDASGVVSLTSFSSQPSTL